MVEVRALVKDFPEVRPSMMFSFTIERGTVFGRLGPNARGKDDNDRGGGGYIAAHRGKVLYKGAPRTGGLPRRGRHTISEHELPKLPQREGDAQVFRISSMIKKRTSIIS